MSLQLACAHIASGCSMGGVLEDEAAAQCDILWPLVRQGHSKQVDKLLKRLYPVLRAEVLARLAFRVTTARCSPTQLCLTLDRPDRRMWHVGQLNCLQSAIMNGNLGLGTPYSHKPEDPLTSTLPLCCCAALILHRHGALPGSPAQIQKKLGDVVVKSKLHVSPHGYQIARAVTDDALGLLHLAGREAWSSNDS